MSGFRITAEPACSSVTLPADGTLDSGTLVDGQGQRLTTGDRRSSGFRQQLGSPVVVVAPARREAHGFRKLTGRAGVDHRSGALPWATSHRSSRNAFFTSRSEALCLRPFDQSSRSS